MARILVVDDEKSIRVTLSRFLAQEGHEVEVAEDAEEALSLLEQVEFDVVVTDIILPRVTGVHLLKAIRGIAPHVPVIMMTGEPTAETASESLRAGAHDYLFKPIEKPEILKGVANAARVKALDDERRLLEQQNQRYREELEALVQERTRELGDSEEERRRLAVAVDQAAESIAITSPDGVIQYVNPAFEANSGYSRKDALGQRIEILSACEEDPAYREMWQTITTGEVWRGRLTNKRKDGTTYHEDVTVSPIRDADGNTVNYVSVGRDITHEIELEAQLRQAQKMEAIGTLAGGIAHDFNNILSPIMGYTEMALSELPEESRMARDLQQVLDASNRATDLVRQILTFSRQREQERQPVRVALIVKEALKLLRASLPSTVEFRHRIEAEEEVVLADPTQIHQILMNLCTNAGHAMRETGGTLTVELSATRVDDVAPGNGLELGSYVRLTVSDTGHGMPTDVLERIFEPYFTTKDRETGEGTGLGLAVVHGIVEACDGTIAVESELGQGTTFYVLLPLVKEVESATAEGRSPLPSGTGRILVVDDEPEMARMVEQMLVRLGYDVLSRTSSMDALDAFAAQPDSFDLVVTDMTMPAMTGVDLSKKLMAIRPEVPIIICTGFSELIDEHKAQALGIRALLMKPVNHRVLAEAVRRSLDSDHPAGTA